MINIHIFIYLPIHFNDYSKLTEKPLDLLQYDTLMIVKPQFHLTGLSGPLGKT